MSGFNHFIFLLQIFYENGTGHKKYYQNREDVFGRYRHGWLKYVTLKANSISLRL